MLENGFANIGDGNDPQRAHFSPLMTTLGEMAIENT